MSREPYADYEQIAERLVEHLHAEAVMRTGGPDVEQLEGTVFLP